MIATALKLAESGMLHDALVRLGIRRLLAARLTHEADTTRRSGSAHDALRAHMQAMRNAPIAVETAAANAQHYEVPPAFFAQVLGPRLKYSSGLWSDGVTALPQAEDAMLALTCARAELQDGMDILELGCGWGSLTLWMAEHFPASRITAVSNSADQRRFILSRCAERGFGNVDVVTADMNTFEPVAAFDRVVSVEMFEHMRNWERLLSRVAGWLRDDGKLFVHIFCHKSHAYLFETEDDHDWMGRYFFTGGMMPSEDLFSRLDSEWTVARHWRVNGRHYARTLLAWLENMDLRADAVWPTLTRAYGEDAALWKQRWRLFFLACAELFAYRGGEEWYVSHYLLSKER